MFSAILQHCFLIMVLRHDGNGYPKTMTLGTWVLSAAVAASLVRVAISTPELMAIQIGLTAVAFVVLPGLFTGQHKQLYTVFFMLFTVEVTRLLTAIAVIYTESIEIETLGMLLMAWQLYAGVTMVRAHRIKDRTQL